MEKDCIGCKAIKDQNFPFGKIGQQNHIDSEGCIEPEETLIYFCPVCGTKL